MKNIISKEISQIQEADLTILIGKVLEFKTIEYKKILPSNSELDKKEFLADVSSFANASGGDIIYGMTEDKSTGLPSALPGLSVPNVDQLILRLDSMIRDGIEPRIYNVTTRNIPLSNGNIALIIRVPKSWISPHRVSYGGHNKFYTRGSNGKYQMDVDELRIAFTLSNTIKERVIQFRSDRISKIFANETPILMKETAKIVLHLIPLISFYPAQRYDLNKVSSTLLPPIGRGGWNHRYNFDGFLTFNEWGYVQFFVNGIIEAVDGYLLDPESHGKNIPSVAFEEEVIEVFTDYFSFLQALNVELPTLVFLTLVNVKGYIMSIKYEIARRAADQIDRDVLLIPEVILNQYNISADIALKPCFDSIWNACGYRKSPNYDENGRWIRKQ